ncbi:Fe(3+)-hydroxamate ABC transporter permease FhuB [Ferrimonas kyonanensis]|uniref:Fe(3+)-hydroxamate ABC transporter permease FhuB n=1 Tax=Ferrimonas kyonanensis TaxID=364763 RepID=UPI0003F55F94|nr:Fe(3+)-hydroxamate ABC transporter permease FhuB [Ferrimonas kyonanensis]
MTLSPMRLTLFMALLSVALAAVSLHHIAGAMPLTQLWHGPADGWQRLLLHYSWAPRQLVALLCGAALGLSGCLFQQCLRNPLASPSTLGVSAGAQLSLTLATLYAPSLLIIGRPWVAIAGALMAAGMALALSSRRRFSPLAVILAGMLLSLYCAAASAGLVLIHHDQLAGVLLWGAGSLIQNDWHSVHALAITLVITALLSTLLIRPLSLLSLGEQVAVGLGVHLGGVRITALILATVLSAMVASQVGIIGFIGLAAPALARLCGCQRFGLQLLWAPILGALTLWSIDLAVQVIGPVAGSLLPTGAVTGLFGAPLLMLLLFTLPKSPPALQSHSSQTRRHHHPTALALVMALLCVLLAAVALLVGYRLEGWAFNPGLLPWRWPRVMAAACAGVLLASSGVMMQRLLANPMASPELLGVSAGAAMGIAVAMMVFDRSGLSGQLGGAIAGAFITLMIISAVNHRNQYQATTLILSGIALSALMEGATVMITASGDPRAATLLSWLNGSTYRVSAPVALTCGLAAALLLTQAALAQRPLQALALGDANCRNCGFHPAKARLGLLALIAMMSGAATLAVGPLSFISLMAPHIARRLGAITLGQQLLVAAPLGAGLLISADWAGRYLIFPWQLPAGLLTTLIGGPYLLWLMMTRR